MSGGPWGESVAQRIEAALDEFVRRLRYDAAVEVESAHRLPVHLAPLIAEVGKLEELGTALLHEILTDGIVLFGQASALASLQPGGLAPWNVVRFSLQGTPARERVRLARRLPGLNLARGAAFLPTDQTRAVRSALEEAGADFDILPVWREV